MSLEHAIEENIKLVNEVHRLKEKIDRAAWERKTLETQLAEVNKKIHGNWFGNGIASIHCTCGEVLIVDQAGVECPTCFTKYWLIQKVTTIIPHE